MHRDSRVSIFLAFPVQSAKYFSLLKQTHQIYFLYEKKLIKKLNLKLSKINWLRNFRQVLSWNHPSIQYLNISKEPKCYNFKVRLISCAVSYCATFHSSIQTKTSKPVLCDHFYVTSSIKIYPCNNCCANYDFTWMLKEPPSPTVGKTWMFYASTVT